MFHWPNQYVHGPQKSAAFCPPSQVGVRKSCGAQAAEQTRSSTLAHTFENLKCCRAAAATEARQAGATERAARRAAWDAESARGWRVTDLAKFSLRGQVTGIFCDVLCGTRSGTGDRTPDRAPLGESHVLLQGNAGLIFILSRQGQDGNCGIRNYGSAHVNASPFTSPSSCRARYFLDCFSSWRSESALPAPSRGAYAAPTRECGGASFATGAGRLVCVAARLTTSFCWVQECSFQEDVRPGQRFHRARCPHRPIGLFSCPESLSAHPCSLATSVMLVHRHAGCLHFILLAVFCCACNRLCECAN